MSAVIEKTISVLPTLLTAAVTGRAELLSATESESYFRSFMKKCKNVTTKQEEEHFIIKELQTIKKKLSSPDIKSKAKRQYLVCLMYCHMVGYDVAFAYIHAVKLAQQGNPLEKRSGYLLCALLNEENSDLSMLLVNTIQKDIRNTSALDICTALTSVTYIVRAEMIPALLPAVKQKFTDKKELVRKKCVLCLWRFHQLAPDMMEHSLHVFEKALCDKNPSVVWAAVGFYASVVRGNPTPYKNMTITFVEILKQTVERRLAPEYNFQGTPAPWLSIHLLKMLAMLGKDDKQTSSLMYQIMHEVLQRTEANSKAGLAVIYECLLSISVIYPEPTLLDKAAKCVSRLLSANHASLKYLGIKALSELVRVSPRFALEHQAVVMECMEHTDSTIQKQAYDLLYGMANPKNLQVISGKLLERMSQTEDPYLKENLVVKLLELCDRFDSNFEWYIRTINEVLVQDHESVGQKNVNKLLHVIFSSTPQCHNVAVRTYWMALNNNTLCDPLLQVAIMTVCEYWRLLPDISANEIVDAILTWLPKSTSTLSQRSAVLGLQKMLPHTTEQDRKIYLTSVREVMQRCNIKDRQILRELEGVCTHSELFSRATKDEHKDSPEFDFTLSFLDGFVLEALENGAQPYKPAHMRTTSKTSVKSETGSLKFEAYDTATSQHSSRSMTSLDQSFYKSTAPYDLKQSVQLKVKKNVWGKEGYNPESAKEIQNGEGSEVSGEGTGKQAQEMSETEKQKSELAKALFEGVEDSYPNDLVKRNSVNLDLRGPHFDLEDLSLAGGIKTVESESEISNDMNQLLQSNLTENFRDQSELGIENSENLDFNFTSVAESLPGNSFARERPTTLDKNSLHGCNKLTDLSVNLELFSDQNYSQNNSNQNTRINQDHSDASKEQHSLYEAFRSHKYANLKDNFDVDSLDGSPDKEAPPMYFPVDKTSEGTEL